MPKNSSPNRLRTVAGRVAATLGAGCGSAAGVLAGHPVAGAAGGAVIALAWLTVEGTRVLTQHRVAVAAVKIAQASDRADAVKRIGALTDLIDKLR